MGFELGAEAAVGERRDALVGLEDPAQVAGPVPRGREVRDAPQRGQPVGEGGDDPEVAVARAAQRPQQIRVMVQVDLEHLGALVAFRDDDLGADEAVAGHADPTSG
ncbi:hypothetical protein [Streptomyces adustus]|uniref:hypothetical protein n=1 Tax=Streptomyces adustus TaxID=1609272 RepID=UPI0037119D96